MAKTFNGRFNGPDKPKSSGTPWLVAGIIFACAGGFTNPVGIAIGVGCFVAYGKKHKEVKIYEKFHEFCAYIGMRERIPLKELSKATNTDMDDLRSLINQMIARGYFGENAMLDAKNTELVLPLNGRTVPPHMDMNLGGWKNMVFDLLNALRNENVFQSPVKAKEETRFEEQVKPAQTEAKPASEEPTPAPAPKAKSRKKTYMEELERTLNELYQLNEQIQDEKVSERINRIGALTGDIFRAVIENPNREQDVRKFMNYYLPTTLKLLRSYDLLEEQSYQSENIIESRKKIESVLDMLIEAYEKQLDRLFSNDALDIASDIDVLETMMAGDGLSTKGQMRMQ